MHDQTIFNNSTLRCKLESGQYGPNSIIIGDSGYRNTAHIAPPLLNPRTNVKLYNEAIIRTRNLVERQYGCLKRRFPVLSLGMRLGLRKIQSVITACAVLHNICIEFDGDEQPPTGPEIPPIQEEEFCTDPVAEANTGALTARDQLLTEYFPALLQQ